MTLQESTVTTSNPIFAKFSANFKNKQQEDMPLDTYLTKCKDNPDMYANIAERLLKAIGQPEIINTIDDDRLGRIHINKKIKRYDTFKDFYGMEGVIEQLVASLKSAANNLEESRQVLYFLGPVGSAKSSLVERLKQLAEKNPIYTIAAYNKTRGILEISPIYESPLGLFDYNEFAEDFENTYNIPKRYMKYIMSPWAVERLREANGDISTFKVMKVWPSILNQVAITKVEPGDKTTQDVTSLIGKVNLRELETYNQNSPDAYNWAGGLNVTTQGILDYVEMFKSSIELLNPLLTATQEGHYNGSEQFGAIPFQGLIVAHSNETEWQAFRNEKKNEAFLDRINIIKVPYCLQVTEEAQIYRKLISNSKLADAPVAPGTFEMMAQYSVLTRLVPPKNSSMFSKMEVYDGKSMKAKDNNAKSLDEYKSDAGVNEGMAGSSTRFAFKLLSKTYSYDSDEESANPIHLMVVLEKQIRQEQLPKEEEDRRLGFINEILKPKFYEFLKTEIQRAYVESYQDYGQNIMERYYTLADYWCQDKEYRDLDTNELYDREILNKELEKLEKPAGISNPKDFRNEVVSFILRYKSNNSGNYPKWSAFEKIAEIIENKIFSNMEELLPVISYGKKASEDEDKKHQKFIARMKEKGYTEKHVRLCVDAFLRYQKHN